MRLSVFGMSYYVMLRFKGRNYSRVPGKTSKNQLKSEISVTTNS